MSGPLEELRDWLASIRLASSGEIVLAIQPFGTVAPFTIRLDDLAALLAASGTGERPAERPLDPSDMALEGQPCPSCGLALVVCDDCDRGPDLPRRHVICLGSGEDAGECSDGPETAVTADAPTPPDAGTGERPADGAEGEQTPFGGDDPRTPGWGQESDPCYLGGWRCSSCPVCPYNPAFTEAERTEALAQQTLAGAGEQDRCGQIGERCPLNGAHDGPCTPAPTHPDAGTGTPSDDGPSNEALAEAIERDADWFDGGGCTATAITYRLIATRLRTTPAAPSGTADSHLVSTSTVRKATTNLVRQARESGSLRSAPDGCITEPGILRNCQRGAEGCIVIHRPAPTPPSTGAESRDDR